MAEVESKEEQITNTNDGGRKISGGDLDTLRDILFGAQAEETDNRLEDLESKLLLANKELSNRIDELNNSLHQQMKEMQADFRQRDDDLRQQLLTLMASLDEQKTSRADLSDMLINMGKELQKAKKSNITASGNEPSK